MEIRIRQNAQGKSYDGPVQLMGMKNLLLCKIVYLPICILNPISITGDCFFKKHKIGIHALNYNDKLNNLSAIITL